MGFMVCAKNELGKPAREEGGRPLGVHFINNFGATGAADAKPPEIRKSAPGGHQWRDSLGQKEEVGQGKMTYAVSLPSSTRGRENL
jgi:hypothetical protein